MQVEKSYLHTYHSTKKKVKKPRKMSDIEKLKTARDKVAEVYESQATDDLVDNGNLSSLNNTLLNINIAIKSIEKQN